MPFRRRFSASFLTLLFFLSACESPPAEGDPDAGPIDTDRLADCGGADRTTCDCTAGLCGPGACIDLPRGALCACDPGYVGNNCDACAVGYATAAGGSECLAELETTQPEAPGESCEHGGVRIDAGLDSDGDGTLDTEEILDTRYSCNTGVPCTGDLCECSATLCGDFGSCVVSTAGARCLCDSGYAGNRCEICAPGFVAGAGSVCGPVQTLTTTTYERRGVNCAAGGDAVRIGEDVDGDENLDPEEVDFTAYDCLVPTVRTGSFVVDNLAELNDLEGVTEITGNLTVTAPFLTDLEPLRDLSKVGTVTVSGNPRLTSLHGLERLEEVASLVVFDNPSLTSLDALHRLTTVSVNLTIDDNDALTSTVGLSSLRTISNHLTIRGNDELTDVAGFESLGRVSFDVLISQNASLAAITGLTALTTVGRDLAVSSHPLLGGITGLSALESVVGAFRITGSSLLASLGGLTRVVAVGGILELTDLGTPTLGNFTSIRELGGLEIVRTAVETLDFPQLVTVGLSLRLEQNSSLQTITGFGALVLVGEDLSIALNPALESIDAFAALEEVRRIFTIEENPSLATVGPMPSLTRVNRVSFGGVVPVLRILDNDSLAALPSFPALALVHGGVEIADNDTLTSLAGLDAVTSVRGLTIQGNAGLTAIDDLQSLTQGLTILIADNAALESIDGFPVLAIASTRTIERNPSLVTIGAFRGTATGTVLIRDNTSLESITGFDAMTGGSLSIVGNPVLTSIAGFAAINSSATFAVENNDALTTLAQLSSLTSTTTAVVRGNAALTELFGVARPIRFSEMTIEDNDALTTLASFVPSALATFVTVALTIRGNALLEDVSGLSAGGYFDTLTIESNPSLQSLAGLETSIGVRTITIRDNDGLSSLDAFPTMMCNPFPPFPPCSVTIADNPAMADVAGLVSPLLSGTTRFFSTFTLEDLPALTSFVPPADLNAITTLMIEGTALPSLTLGTVTVTDLVLRNNDAMTTLGAPPVMSTTSSDLTLDGNDGLVDLAGGGSITRLGALTITNHAALMSVTGLSGFVRTTVRSQAPVATVSVTNNAMLPACQVVAHLENRASSFLYRFGLLTNTGNDDVAVCP